jgi:hypothetical protein
MDLPGSRVPRNSDATSQAELLRCTSVFPLSRRTTELQTERPERHQGRIRRLEDSDVEVAAGEIAIATFTSASHGHTLVVGRRRRRASSMKRVTAEAGTPQDLRIIEVSSTVGLILVLYA